MENSYTETKYYERHGGEMVVAARVTSRTWQDSEAGQWYTEETRTDERTGEVTIETWPGQWHERPHS